MNEYMDQKYLLNWFKKWKSSMNTIICLLKSIGNKEWCEYGNNENFNKKR